MKLFRHPYLIVALLWCAAVMLAPVAFAQESGSGSVPGQGGVNHRFPQGNMNTMPAQPPGNTGNSNAPGGPPGGAQDTGNMTMSRPPFGNDGNADFSGGPGGSQDYGNMTMPQPPSGGLGNATDTSGPGNWQGGNMTSPDFRNQDSGNMTAREDGQNGWQGIGNVTRHAHGNWTAGNATFPGNGPDDLQGNGNMTSPPPGNWSTGNMTAPGNGQNGTQGDRNMTSPSGSNNQGLAGQQASGNNITDIVNRIQALLSSIF
jgi:hypothetical protein